MSDPILGAPDPYAATALMLHLSWLRSSVLVGLALADRFPSAEAWEAAMQDPELQAELGAYAEVVRDIRALAHAGSAFDLARLQALGDAHRDRALDALRLTSERLGVDADDLVVALVHAV